MANVERLELKFAKKFTRFTISFYHRFLREYPQLSSHIPNNSNFYTIENLGNAPKWQLATVHPQLQTENRDRRVVSIAGKPLFEHCVDQEWDRKHKPAEAWIIPGGARSNGSRTLSGGILIKEIKLFIASTLLCRVTSLCWHQPSCRWHLFLVLSTASREQSQVSIVTPSHSLHLHRPFRLFNEANCSRRSWRKRIDRRDAESSATRGKTTM